VTLADGPVARKGTDSVSALPPELDPRGGRRSTRPRAVTRGAGRGAPRPAGVDRGRRGAPGRGAPPPARPVTSRRRGARPSTAGRGVHAAAVVVAVLVLVLATAGYVFQRYYYSQLTKIGLALPKGFKAPAASLDVGSMNVLLVGSDTRAGKGNSAYQAAKGSSTYVEGARSDTMMLAHIPSGGSPITVVSIPRDSWVYIPAWHGIPAHYNKLNSAFSEGNLPGGNPQLLVATIERLTGVVVNHYMQIDFAGFKRMVNALGGVTVCVRTARHDVNSGDFLTAGTHHINGTQALAFVRDRESFANQDITRMKDQQYFLSVMLRKVMSTGVLANPFKLNGFLSALASSVTVDRGFSFNDLRNFALAMRHIGTKNVRFTTIPIANPNAFVDYQSVVLLDRAKDHALFAAWNRAPGTGPKQHGPARYTITVAPSAVHVAVLNASSINGLAHSTASSLTSVGFPVSSVGNATTSPAGTDNLVEYGPGQSAAAQTLAAAVHGAMIMKVPGLGSTLQLVLGGSRVNVQTVHVGEVVPTARYHHIKSVGTSAAAMSCAP
jgi:LCP family protein required for cell wall assembly